MYYPLIFVFLVLLGGCQSRVPIEIREPVLGSPSVAIVQQDIKPYVGKFVRWGGVIVSVENRTNETWVEIVSKELNDKGQPLKSDVSLGRFLARSQGFIDPAVYQPEREATVYGTVETLVTRKIGESPYVYPVVKVEKLYLWPKSNYLYGYRYYPWPGYFYYPYYYPFYPYYYRFGYFPYW
jgi:outer membrane lipoprotein